MFVTVYEMILVIMMLVVSRVVSQQKATFNVKNYHPNICIINVQGENPGPPVIYDLSRVAGPVTLVKRYEYVEATAEEEAAEPAAALSFLPHESRVEVRALFCSYMRPAGEVLLCGQQRLRPPAACITVTHNSSSTSLSTHHHMNSYFVSGGLYVDFTINQGTEEGGEKIRFKLTNSFLDEKELETIEISRKRMTVKWSSESFYPAYEISVNDSCLLKTGNQTFDLGPSILESGYSVESANGSRYLLHFCRNKLQVAERDYGACRKGFAICLLGDSTLAYFNSSQLVYSSHKGLFMRYTDGRKVYQVNFVCRSGSTGVRVGLVSEEPVLMFNVYSSLSCPRNTVVSSNCEINLGNNVKYSFDALTETARNIVIPSVKGSSYMLNLCRTLIPTTGQPFTGGDIFAVFIEEGRSSVVNLGVQQLPPYVDQNNNIVMGYNGSDKCGNDGYHNLTVGLVCNRFESKAPEVLATSDECLHQIKWETTFACPFSYRELSDCTVNSVDDAPSFDFTSLRKPRDDYQVETSNGWIQMNICSYLNSYAEMNVTAVYRRKGGKELVIGRSVKTEIRDGHITSVYTGGDLCTSLPAQSFLFVSFTCATDSSPPHLTKEADECNFWVEWQTKQACTASTPTRTSCFQSNLAGLPNSSLLVGHQFTALDHKDTVHFTMCGGLSGAAAVLCGPSVSACWISDQRHSHQRIVKFKMDGFKKIDKLHLMYESESLCEQPSTLYSLHIQLECAYLQTAEVGVAVIGRGTESSACELWVRVSTVAACAHADSTVSTIPPSRPPACRMLSYPKVDLSHLKEHSWVSEEPRVNVSVCAPLAAARSLCPTGAGVCEEVDGTVEGFRYSDVLLYRPRLPYLNYSGPGCLSTLLTFPCHSHNHDQQQQQAVRTFRALDDCTNILTWPTDASCIFQSELVPDICRMAELNDYLRVYNVSVSDESHLLIGVCSSLPPQCLVSTGACLVQHTSNSTTHFYTSLGYPVKETSKDNFGNWIVKFIDGAMCNKTGQQYSTVFKFICDTSVNKVSLSYTYDSAHCLYSVEMRDPKLCSTLQEDDKSSSGTTDQQHRQQRQQQLQERTRYESVYRTLAPCSHTAPLRCLLDTLATSPLHPLHMTDDVSKKEYLLEFDFKAESLRSCGVSVCDLKINRWTPRAQFHDIAYFPLNESFKIEFKGASVSKACQGFSGVDMFMKCQEDLTRHMSTAYDLNPDLTRRHMSTAYNLNPVVKWDSGCVLGVEWYTEYACVGPRSGTPPRDSTSSAAGSPAGERWTVAIVTVVVGVLLAPLCAALLVFRRNCCRQALRALRRPSTRHRGPASPYFSQVNSRLSYSSISGDTTAETELFVRPSGQSDTSC